MLHQTSGHWRLGLALSLITACLWGTMPNILSIALQSVDTYTLTWFRFLCSFLLLGLYQVIRSAILGGPHGLSKRQSKLEQNKLEQNKQRKQDPRPRVSLFRTRWLWLIVAILGVGLDYPLYLLGMAQTSPANSEVVIQVAPVLMGLGGIVIFKERYNYRQWIGVGVLFAGFGLFFHEQLRTLATASAQYLWGSSLVLLAAISWTAYALAQKLLLRVLDSEVIMLTIYGACTLLYTLFAEIQSLSSLDPASMAILFACGFSTLISYGAFAESLQHWEASKISAIQSLTPIITITTSWLIAVFLPALPPAQISLTGIAGALLVVVGSMTIALGQRSFSLASADPIKFD